ncbi:MAG TPA: extracellular solute-binding protein [Coriobacteriia bacterium]|nr:extracellular solute-binding protein [Coriobacteriia bacterium]
MLPTTRLSDGRRRAIVSAASVVALAALAVGCSGAESPTSPTSANGAYVAPASDLTADITYAFWDETQKAAIEANVAGFNELYPNIKVNLDVTSWEGYWTKLQTQASSDTLADLFWLNGALRNPGGGGVTRRRWRGPR